MIKYMRTSTDAFVIKEFEYPHKWRPQNPIKKGKFETDIKEGKNSLINLI